MRWPPRTLWFVCWLQHPSGDQELCTLEPLILYKERSLSSEYAGRAFQGNLHCQGTGFLGRHRQREIAKNRTRAAGGSAKNANRVARPVCQGNEYLLRFAGGALANIDNTRLD